MDSGFRRKDGRDGVTSYKILGSDGPKWDAGVTGKATHAPLPPTSNPRVLPGLQDRQHFFGKELQASLRNMERRAAEAEGDVQLEIAKQGPAVLKPP